MHFSRLAIALLACATGRATLTAEDSPRGPIGPPFGEHRYATIYEGYELRRVVPEGMTWEQFARLAPSPEALRRVLFRQVPDVESLSGEEENWLADLAPRLSLRVTADSWAELLAKTKPSFTWHDGDLLWIEQDKRGEPQFTLDEAHLYQPPGASPRWVLLDEGQCAQFDPDWGRDVMGRNLRAVAKLVPTAPGPAHDSGEIDGDGYAVVLGREPRGGTVYEVGWQGLMANGVAHPVVLRKIYLRRDPAGRWEFLGEGCANYYDREGANEAVAGVEWVESKSGPTPEIRFVATDDDHGHFSSEDQVPADWRDVIMLKEHVLAAPFPAQLRQTTAHPYLIAERADTFDKIVEHLVRDQYGWMVHDEPTEADRSAAREMCRAVLRRLNPALPLGPIAAGTKVQVLNYAELVYEVEWRRGRR